MDSVENVSIKAGALLVRSFRLLSGWFEKEAKSRSDCTNHAIQDWPYPVKWRRVWQKIIKLQFIYFGCSCLEKGNYFVLQIYSLIQ
jgi:hypothetical protein